MKFSIIRCKHCGTLYKYGGRSVRDNHWFMHSSDFCPECREAIWRTLNGIPKRFEPRWMEVTSEKAFEDVRSYMQLVKGRKALPEYDSGCFKTYPIEPVPDGMASGDAVVYSRTKHALCKDASGNEHAFVWWEFDLEKGSFGENLWECVMEDIVYPLQEPMVFRASDIVPHEIEKPVGQLNWIDFENAFASLDDKTKESLNYPRYHGNGMFELDKGVFGGEKLVEELNQAILDEVSNEETDEKDKENNTSVNEQVCRNAERFLNLLYDVTNYCLAGEVKTEDCISFCFHVIGGYINVQVGVNFIQYYTNFRNGVNYYSENIPCNYTDLPRELVRLFEKT